MNTEEPIAETRRPHPHRKLAINTANVGKRSSARQIPGKNKDFGPKSDAYLLLSVPLYGAIAVQ